MYDAIIISDLHLGSNNCQAKLINTFLDKILHKEINTKMLILNGDVFDSINFKRLKKTHWKVLSTIRHLSDKIETIWIEGNHDEIIPDTMSHLLGVDVKEYYILNSNEIRIFITHGHKYDDFITKHPTLTNIADFFYNILQKLDPSHKISKFAKSTSKTFVRCTDKIKLGAIKEAKKHMCGIAICSHTHHKESSQLYYNTGCWTELPCSYLTIKNGVVELKEFTI